MISGSLNSFLAHRGVDQDPAAILTDDDLLHGGNVQLTLGRNLVKAASAGITFHRHHSQSVAGICPDLLVGGDSGFPR